MSTTVDRYGHLISGPMTCRQIDEDGNFWLCFATGADLWGSIAAEPNRNLSLLKPADPVSVSVSGLAERVVAEAAMVDAICHRSPSTAPRPAG